MEWTAASVCRIIPAKTTVGVGCFVACFFSNINNTVKLLFSSSAKNVFASVFNNRYLSIYFANIHICTVECDSIKPFAAPFRHKMKKILTRRDKIDGLKKIKLFDLRASS